MEKPKCRLCNERHYSYEDHIWPVANKEIIANNVANIANTVKAEVDIRVALPDGVVPKAKTAYQKWREANPDLYKQRQRELMRKKRGTSL